VLHHILWRHLDRQAIWSQGCIQHWVQIHVRHEDGLTDRRLVVQPRAAVSMATSPAENSSMADIMSRRASSQHKAWLSRSQALQR
jgi:hypothetical protein